MIAELRQALADALDLEVGSAATVWAWEPDQLAPPAVVVDYGGTRPSDDGVILDEHSFTVAVFAYANLTNPAAADEADVLCEAVIRTLRTFDHTGTAVGSWDSRQDRRVLGGTDHRCVTFTVPIVARNTVC